MYICGTIEAQVNVIEFSYILLVNLLVDQDAQVNVIVLECTYEFDCVLDSVFAFV